MQRGLLAGLLRAIRNDKRWAWLLLSCSVARGAGDALSDLDLGLGVREDYWPEAVGALPQILQALGATVELLEHRIDSWGEREHRRLFVQYADGGQIDLVALPAAARPGHTSDEMVLYDPDGLLTQALAPALVTASRTTQREWAVLAWVALADADKYLRRGSLWEALARLEEARTGIWRLWAAAHAVPYPAFGLTAVLDHPEAGLPPGIEASVAQLDAADLRRAALATAALLRTVGGQALGEKAPEALAMWVEDRLMGRWPREPR